MTETTMNSKNNPAKIRTVIAARPGFIRESLRATLALVPRLEICAIGTGGLSTLDLIHKYRPASLVIDSGLLQDEIEMLLVQAKQEQPQIQIIVVTNTYSQKQKLLDLKADAVILHKEPVERLLEALRDLEIP